MGYAFISYSSKNRSSADAMIALLRQRHIDVWVAPDDIPPGSKYAQVIGRAIKECACMVLLFTNDAQNSSWVPKEVERAINYKKTIIPVQLEEVQLNEEFELYISTEQIISVDRIDEKSDKIQWVIDSVIAKTGQNTPASGKEQTPDPASGAKIVTAEEKPKRKRSTSLQEREIKAPVELLSGSGELSVDTEELRETAHRLDETLKSFRIAASITKVVRGAAVTRYEIALDQSVRLNKLTSIADDIAFALGVSGVRIATIPGKLSAVGIEVPNRNIDKVSLREIIDSVAFTQSKDGCTFAVGKDIDGNCIVSDLAKLPHLLVAGSTGSGIPTFMNSLILSLLYKSSADDVRMIMIDTKLVEMSAYVGIPHLLVPRVTSPELAVGSLQWVVSEMMNRFQIMAGAQVRDLERYNSAMESTGGKKLPRIVVIVNELADLMRSFAEETEEAVCRIAQLGRAAGIHLVLATQRVSSDVITGLIKANIPSRIAFSLSSTIESRIILDTTGAEKLLGHGDMLFAPIGLQKPLRVQGCFVDSQEVRAVAEYVRAQGTISYDHSAMAKIKAFAAQSAAEEWLSASKTAADQIEEDPMLPAAVEVVLETGMVSVSLLQRRLMLGYARAARLVDRMEELELIGPYLGSKPRKILVTKEQWAAMSGNQAKS
jgi:S-DNA-T family DNA segregation ATPase FtsK/SpoIIIE